MLPHWPMIDVVHTTMGNTNRVNVAPSQLIFNRASTERQQYFLLDLVSSITCAMVLNHSRSIDRLDMQYG